MAQKAQIIDITRSYIPGDPNAFPENLISTQKEDGEEKSPSVSAFEGYNFLPTPYGYRSFFGTASRLNVPDVPARVQSILAYQSGEYVNNLLALCEDGIWVLDPTAALNTWKHVVIHPFAPTVFEEWTWCVIENTVYMYKQGGATVYRTSDTDDAVNGLSISILSEVPTFLNMTGQMGIFKAGTRLGFWDSANSVSWSSNLVLSDFAPSLENLAGNTIFGSIVGRITHVRDHGEGFIIYATKSITGISFSAEGNMLWDSHVISQHCGVAIGRSVTHGSSNSEHLAFTTTGLFRIGGFNGLTKVHEFAPVAIELSDLLKEGRDPVYLDCIEDRYLYLHCINNDYINGKISFESFTVDDITIDTIPPILPSKLPSGLFIKKMQKIERDTTDQAYGDLLVKYSSDGTPFDVIEWEVSYKTISPLGLAEKYKEPSLGASFAYADAGTLDRTSLSWDNRTATAGVFVDSDGTYASLELTTVLPVLADFLVRGTEVQNTFDGVIDSLTLFQEDALGGTFSTSYKLQKSLGTQPSYLALVGSTNLGMIEGMYNVESLWKDFEKRQKLAIARFTEIVDGLVDQDWIAYSTTDGLEGTIGAPIYEIFNFYKPYGCVGVQKQGKGFFFYKQYRDMWDCVIAATRTVADSIQRRMTGEGAYEGAAQTELKDSLGMSVTLVSGGEASFPNPNQFPVSIVGVAGGGSWATDGQLNEFLFHVAIIDSTTGVVSDKKLVAGAGANLRGAIDVPVGGRVKLDITTPAPAGYMHRIYITSMNYEAGSVRYRNMELVVGTSSYINSLTDGTTIIADYPTAFVDTTDNTYLVTGSGWSLAVSDGGGGVLPTTSMDAYVYRIKESGQSSPLVSIGTIVKDAYDELIFNSPPLLADETGVLVLSFVHATDGPMVYYLALNGYPGQQYVDFAFSFDNIPGDYYFSTKLLNPWYGPLTWATSSPGVPTTYSMVVTPDAAVLHSPRFLRDLQEDSENNPIFIEGAGLNVKLKPFDAYDQLLTAPWTTTGKMEVQAYSEEMPGGFIVTLNPMQALCLPNDYLTAKPEVAVQFRVQKESEETHAEYPYLMSPMGSLGDFVAYYQSFEQAALQMSMYGHYLQAIMAFAPLPSGKDIRPSLDMADYHVEYKNDVVELWCTRINEAWNPHLVTGVIALLHQNSGFIYEYDVAETMLGSIEDSIDVDLSGASLAPTLSNQGVFNTVGGFFSPKNKISATMNAGTLALGAATTIGDYAANSTEILDFLQPTDSLFLSSKYLLPPTYDDGERWYLIEDADTIYETGTPFHHKEGTISSIDTPVWNTPLYLADFPPYDIPVDDTVIVAETLGTLPGATFLLQEGIPAPAYPTFTGAYVFDLHLKKWGKMQTNYKAIFSFSPLNSNIGGTIPFTNFGMDCGVILDSMQISLFDKAPTDSWIRYGKMGYTRLGMTHLLEVKAMFRSVSQVKITTDTSLDGRTLRTSLRYIESFVNTIGVTAFPDISGRWHTVKIEGNYDLQYLEVRGKIAGRR